jgi:hypothetical protein
MSNLNDQVEVIKNGSVEPKVVGRYYFECNRCDSSFLAPVTNESYVKKKGFLFFKKYVYSHYCPVCNNICDSKCTEYTFKNPSTGPG